MSNLRWTPFGDVSLDMGCLAVVEASHKDSQFKQLQVAWDVGGLNNLDIYMQGRRQFAFGIKIFYLLGDVWQLRLGSRIGGRFRMVH